MKKIEDYLHLYLGCKLKNTAVGSVWILKSKDFVDIKEWIDVNKPILRPLSDMSEEEADWIIENTNLRQVTMGRQKKDFAIALSERWSANSHVLLYLLSKHFDLFNLIPEGLAIEKQL